jgi:hypothetical protein
LEKYPRKCSGKDCEATFGESYKVTKNKSVFACCNAIDDSHPCQFALCKPCRDKLVLGVDDNDGSNKRRKNLREHAPRVILNPGERLDEATGCIYGT